MKLPVSLITLTTPSTKARLPMSEMKERALNPTNAIVAKKKKNYTVLWKISNYTVITT